MGRTPAPGGRPRSRAREGERVGGRDCGGAAGQGANPTRRGPWNRKGHPCHSGSDSGEMCSCCPRRKAGSFAGWLLQECLAEGGGGKEMSLHL